MTEKSKIWNHRWGNLCWQNATPAQIDALIEKGEDVSEVHKKDFPLGYEYATPLLSSIRANNPVAFSHLIKKGADLNFRLPYTNLYPEGPRHGNSSIITEAPSLIYIKYAYKKGMKVYPEDFKDVIKHKGKRTNEKLSFLVDIFEKRKNSQESLKVLSYFPLIDDEAFKKQHFSKLLENVKIEDLQTVVKNEKENYAFKQQVLKMITEKSKVSRRAEQNLSDTLLTATKINTRA